MSEKRKARRDSRRLAIKAVFYYLEREEKVSMKECFSFVLQDVEEKSRDPFAREILESGVDNLGKIKVLIKAFAPEYPYEKIAPINRAMLILGIGEMKFLGTPPVVVINEYVELAKEFGEDKSASFLNGVLDNYRKSAGLEGSRKEKEGDDGN